MKKLTALALIGVLYISGCLEIPDEIIIPEWDVDLNIPVVNRNYTINDIIGEQENLSIEPDSIYLIHTREYTQSRNLLDFIKLDEAVNQNNIILPPLNASRDIFLNFRTDVVLIDSATFSGGFINLNVRNQSSLTVSFSITTPGITSNGNELVISAALPPGESRVLRQELAGYKYSEPANQTFPYSLWIIAESSASGTNTGGNLQFDVEISDFFFNSVTGRFTEQDVGRKTDTIDAHLGENLDDFRDKITLQSATLKLSALYQSLYPNPFNLRVDSLTLVGKYNGEEIYLTDSTGSRYINFTVTQGSIHIEFNESNSNILDIINFIPDVFEISASFRILGNNQTGTITSEDISNILIDINTRSIAAIARSTVVDTFALQVKLDDREDIRDAQFSTLTMEIANAIPVKGFIRVDFLDSLQNYLFTLSFDNTDSLTIEGAEVNILTGEVISPSELKRALELTREEIINLSHSYYVITSVSIETTAFKQPDPPLVRIKASDWLRFNLYGQVRYHVNIDEL